MKIFEKQINNKAVYPVYFFSMVKWGGKNLQWCEIGNFDLKRIKTREVVAYIFHARVKNE